MYWTLCGNEGKSRGRRGRFSSTSSIRYLLLSFIILRLANIDTKKSKINNFELKTRNIKIFIGQAVTRSRQKGYKVVCGRWLVEGNPQVILFDVGSAAFKMAEFKHELYEKAGIGIPNDDIETNDVCIFG